MDKGKKWRATIYCEFDTKSGMYLRKERTFGVEHFDSEEQARVWAKKTIERLDEEWLEQDEWWPLFEYYLQEVE